MVGVDVDTSGSAVSTRGKGGRSKLRSKKDTEERTKEEKELMENYEKKRKIKKRQNKIE